MGNKLNLLPMLKINSIQSSLLHREGASESSEKLHIKKVELKS